MKRLLLFTISLLLFSCISHHSIDVQNTNPVVQNGKSPATFSKHKFVLQVKDQQKIEAMLATAHIIPERLDLLRGLADIVLLTFPETISPGELQHAVDQIRLDDNTMSAHQMLFSDEGKEVGGFLSDLIVKKGADVTQASFLTSIRQSGLNGQLLDGYDPNVFIVSGKAAAIDPVTVCSKLVADGLAEFAQPNCLRFIEQTGTPGDPLFNSQWGLPIMKLPQAWDISAGCASIKIAIIDNGVQLNHPDLVNNLVPGFDATGGGSAGGAVAGEESHGTNCAGIAAAPANNLGIAGAAYKCKILPIRAYATQGQKIASIGGAAKDKFIVAAINHAANNAHVISMSWNLGQASDLSIDQAIDNALTGAANKGRILIGAVGNDNVASSLLLPCRNANVLAVGASNYNDLRWPGSNKPATGSRVDLVAPGPKVCTVTGSGYSTNTTESEIRTSWSTPAVAGIAALILSVKPSLTQQQVKQLLVETCDKVGGYNYVLGNNSKFPALTHNNEMGHGRVNALTALSKAIGGPISGPDKICTTGKYSLAGAAAGAVSWSSSNASILTINASTGAATKVGNGLVTVKATINYGCGTGFITKDVNVGGPDPNANTYDLSATPVGSLNIVSPYDAHYVELRYDATSVAWNPVWSSGIPSGSPGILRFDFALQPGQSLFFSPLAATNSCGTTSQTVEFWAPWPVVTYPNPADDEISIDFSGSKMPERIDLWSEKSSKPVRSFFTTNLKSTRGNAFKINVADLPRGTYYLHLSQDNGKGNRVQKVRIELK